MIKIPRRVAVLGAGTMGSQIAAHLANVGIPTLLLDLPSEGESGAEPAARAKAGLAKIKPAAFFLGKNAALIETGNFRDHLGQISDCDWVVEAIVERLDVKRQLWQRVESLCNPASILSSNTSGLPLTDILEGFSLGFRQKFLGTHFFNPPRYMRLLEIIPGPDTAPEVLARMEAIGDRLLGKGIVHAKDRPNFIANRIGVFVGAKAADLRQRLKLKVEDVDQLAGPLIGRPRTANFKLGDLVGIDVMLQVCQNLYHNLPNDPWREIFQGDQLTRELVRRGWTGRKAGLGFYKKEGRNILVIDPATMEFQAQNPTRYTSVAEVAKDPDLSRRVRVLISANDDAGRFLWPYLRDTFAYTAQCVPEIADRVYEVDRAMRWGFNWEMGPFELWDALGTAEIAARIAQDGIDLPNWIREAIRAGGFYGPSKDQTYFNLGSRQYQLLPSSSDKPNLTVLRSQTPPILEASDASLLDLGDGVAGFEFHSKMNSLTGGIVEFSSQVMDEVERNFIGLVIGNQAADFSVGANLVGLLTTIRNQAWEELDRAVCTFQKMTRSFRYSSKPVVAAPFGRTLAGGAEICLGCDAVVAQAETYMGLGEVGVGLIPAGGGTTEVLARCTREPTGDLRADRSAGLKQAFEIVGMAKVSTSAEEARLLHLLAPQDEIEIHPERLLWRAKQRVLTLAGSYKMPAIPNDIPVTGEAGLSLLRLGLHLLRQAEFISDHDHLIWEKLAFVLSGGNLNRPTPVSEPYLLDLEREAFLSLCGESKTQDRIQFMLEQGKPLRN